MPRGLTSGQLVVLRRELLNLRSDLLSPGVTWIIGLCHRNQSPFLIECMGFQLVQVLSRFVATSS